MEADERKALADLKKLGGVAETQGDHVTGIALKKKRSVGALPLLPQFPHLRLLSLDSLNMTPPRLFGAGRTARGVEGRGRENGCGPCRALRRTWAIAFPDGNSERWISPKSFSTAADWWGVTMTPRSQIKGGTPKSYRSSSRPQLERR